MVQSLEFQELGYNQPSISIAKAAEAAVTVIKDLLAITPSVLPYIMEPSAILLFAGLRAQSPYHVLGDEVSEELKENLDAVLTKHGICRWSDDTAYDNSKSGVFSLVNTVALDDIPNHYGFAKDIWKSPVVSPTVPQICEWVLVMERALVGLMESDTLPEEWLRDWWTPHNLRFGMLLGYPGVAISSNLWAESHFRFNGAEDAVTEIIVAEDGQYFGTRVSFYITTDAADNPSAKNVKHIWNEVIKQVYAVMPLNQLLLNKDFEKGYRHLERRETYES